MPFSGAPDSAPRSEGRDYNGRLANIAPRTCVYVLSTPGRLFLDCGGETEDAEDKLSSASSEPPPFFDLDDLGDGRFCPDSGGLPSHHRAYQIYYSHAPVTTRSRHASIVSLWDGPAVGSEAGQEPEYIVEHDHAYLAQSGAEENTEYDADDESSGDEDDGRSPPPPRGPYRSRFTEHFGDEFCFSNEAFPGLNTGLPIWARIASDPGPASTADLTNGGPLSAIETAHLVSIPLYSVFSDATTSFSSSLLLLSDVSSSITSSMLAAAADSFSQAPLFPVAVSTESLPPRKPSLAAPVDPSLEAVHGAWVGSVYIEYYGPPRDRAARMAEAEGGTSGYVAFGEIDWEGVLGLGKALEEGEGVGPLGERFEELCGE